MTAYMVTNVFLPCRANMSYGHNYFICESCETIYAHKNKIIENDEKWDFTSHKQAHNCRQ